MNTGFLKSTAACAGIGFAAVLLSEALGDYVLYRHLIVPRLPAIQSVPTTWWLAAFSPLMLTAALLGLFCGSVKRLLAATLGGTSAALAYEFTTAYMNLTGHLKTVAAENPLYFVLTTGPLIFLAIAATTGAVFATVTTVRRKSRAPLTSGVS